MKFEDFHNALRIMRCIDSHELENAGIVEIGSRDGLLFLRNPYLWFISTDDETARKLFALIERRQPVRSAP